MKYAEYILKHIIPEWAFMYLNYTALKQYLSTSGALKDFLITIKKTKSLQEYKDIKKNVLEMTYLIAKIEADNKEFKKKFILEIEKLKQFIYLKHNDLKGKTYKLQLQLFSMVRYQKQLERNKEKQSIKNKSQVIDDLTQGLSLKKIKIKQQELNIKSKQLKELCFQLYQEGINFNKYLDVNNEAIRKVLKKQKKKNIKINPEQIIINQDLNKIVQELEIFQIQTKLKQLLFQIEKYLLKHFYQTKQELCKELLRKYQNEINKNDKAWFQFGMFTGFSIMILSFIIFLATQNQLSILNNNRIYESFPIYRGALLFILYYWSLTILVFLWNRKKINYRLYLNFNHHFSTLNELLKRVMTLTSIFLLVCITYICDVSKLGILFSNLKFEDYYPIIIWISLIMTLFFPSKQFINGKGRMWVYRTFFESFNKYKIEERHLFLISQLTSLIIPLTDFVYTTCEYSKGIHKQNDDDGNQYDECFFISRYITLGIVLFPYFLLSFQIVFLTLKKQYQTRFLIDLLKYFISMTSIIFATLSYSDHEYFYYWLGFAILHSSLNIIGSINSWNYLDKKQQKKGKLSYKTQLFLIYLPFAIIQPLSISTSIFGVFDKNEQHSWTIFYIGFIELIRRMIINYYLVDAEHFKNKQAYQTVGQYIFPFDECCSTIRKTQLKYYEIEDSDEDENTAQMNSIKQEIISEKPVEIIIQEQQQQQLDERLNFGLCIQGTQTIDSNNKTQFLKTKFNLSELVSKESEKALGDSFLHYDINNFTPDNFIDLQYQQISETEIQRLHTNNKHYKKEIKQLYDQYNVKFIK